MAKFLNLFLITIASFFLCFCWLSYYHQPLWARYALSALLSFMLLVLLCVLQKKAESAPTQKDKRMTKAKKIALALTTNYDLFLDVLRDKNQLTEKLADNSYCIFGEKKILVEFAFRLNNLSVQDLINATKRAIKTKADKIFLFCISADSSLWRFQNDLPLPISVFDFDACTKLLYDNGKTITPLPLRKKRPFFDKNVFYFAFAKNRSKHYFGIALLLLLSAIISFYPLYNIIIATVCFCLGVYSLFNKRFNSKNPFIF